MVEELRELRPLCSFLFEEKRGLKLRRRGEQERAVRRMKKGYIGNTQRPSSYPSTAWPSKESL